jgi:hypothetical protein
MNVFDSCVLQDFLSSGFEIAISESIFGNQRPILAERLKHKRNPSELRGKLGFVRKRLTRLLVDENRPG